MKFSHVAEYFQKIESESSRTGMTHLLAQLFGESDAREIGIITNLSLGQLHPPYLSTKFNLAEKNIIKALAELFQEPEQSIVQLSKQLGDLGLVAQQGSWKALKSLSVLEVYDALIEIEEISGTGSQEDKLSKLTTLLKNLDPLSAKYIVRIILSKLRLGFSDMTLIDALSWMQVGDKSLKEIIENAYNVCVDIGYIASQLKEHGTSALEKMHIQVGVPIRPAAAERLPNATEIMEKIGECVVEPKIDGFRLQVHVKKGKKTEVHFFSRNLIDMSYMFPDLKDEVSKMDVQDVIFEGEAIVYDPNTGTFLPFQETVKRKRKHGIEEVMQEFPLRVFAFNLFYLNGHQKLSLPEHERRDELVTLFKKNKSDAFQAIEQKQMKTVDQLQAYFDMCIAAGLEGIMVKRSDARYQPGKRNFNWIKFKRSSVGQLEDTIDCVVLGYYAGEGKRASFGIGAFLVGVYNPKLDRFETVAKIGTGLSDEQWQEMKSKCDAIAMSGCPKNVIVAKELAPDVWVNPEIVCITRADEITVSPLHTAHKTEKNAGFALRFPRFEGYRTDKSASEATTISEILRLYEDQFKHR